MIDTKQIMYEVIDAFHVAPQEAKDEFLNCPKGKLIQYHHTLGRVIRNEFKLWEHKWIPELIDGFDHSKEHPDQISMTIIEMVWEELQNEK